MRPELPITCPKCKKPSNEYNWTLKTAAYFSRGEETCPALLQVLLSSLSGSTDFDGFRLICPLCNQGSDLEEVAIPSGTEVLRYAEEMGSDYAEAWF